MLALNRKVAERDARARCNAGRAACFSGESPREKRIRKVGRLYRDLVSIPDERRSTFELCEADVHASRTQREQPGVQSSGAYESDQITARASGQSKQLNVWTYGRREQCRFSEAQKRGFTACKPLLDRGFRIFQ
jgi:hypothetical protein